MNEKKYLSYLEQYHQWLIAHQEKANDELTERETHAKEMQKYDKGREDHGVGSTDHFLKFLYYTSFLTPHDPTSKFST